MRFQNDPYLDQIFRDRDGLETAIIAGGTSRNSFVNSFTVTRELSGDVPDSVSLLGGAVSAFAKLSCDGRQRNALSPFRAVDRKNFVGKPAFIGAGYEFELLSLFTGRGRSISGGEASGTVDLELMENSDTLRAPLSLPAFGSKAHPMSVSRVNRYPTNLTAIIVAALHRCGVRVTPRPREHCVLSVPLTYGLLADVGWTVPGGMGVPAGTDWLTPGKFGLMPRILSGGMNWNFSAFPSRATTWGFGAAAQVEFWYNHEAGVAGRTVVLEASAAGKYPMLFTVQVEADGTYYLNYSVDGYAWFSVDRVSSRKLTAGWSHIAFETGFYSNQLAKMWRNGIEVSNVPVGSWSEAGKGGQLRVQQLDPGRVQALNMYYHGNGALSAPSPSTIDVVPSVSLDRALLEVDVVPDISGRVSWEVCKEVASAELGMVGFDEDGKFFFKNRDTLNGSTVPVATWSTDVVADLTASSSVDSIRTRVTGRVVKRWMTEAGRGAETAASTAVPSFLASDPLVFPKGTSTHLLFGDAPFTAETSGVHVITTPGMAWDTAVGMALCKDPGGLNRETNIATTWVHGSIRPLGPTTWELTVTNGLGYPLYAVWPAAWTGSAMSNPPFGFSAGDTAFWVLGRRFDSNTKFPIHPIDVSDPAALTEWGDRTLDLGESPWRQDPAAVQQMAVRMLADLKEPRMEIGDITVPADLRWQIGDPVRVTDWQGRVPDFVARITRSEITVSLDVENGMTGVYSLRSLPTTGTPYGEGPYGAGKFGG